MKHICSECGCRPATYRTRWGTIKADADHTLCMRCAASEISRLFARKLANTPERKAA